MSYSELGQKIKNARIEMDMTQKALCGDDITRNMLSRIETGNAYPSLETLCILASRLGMPPGYFIDDSDDGETLRNRRLLSMIEDEYQRGNYSLCLDYAKGINGYRKELGVISAVCSFKCGVERMMAGELYRAVEYFDTVVEKSRDVDANLLGCRADAEMYSAYINSFIAHTAPGEDAEAIASVLKCEGCGNDIVKIAAISEMIKSGAEAAVRLLSVTAFTEKKHRAFCEGMILCEKGEFRSAKKHLHSSIDGLSVPMLSVWCLSLLEKCAAGMRDFENAYAHSIRRREAVDRLVSGTH